MAEIEPAIKDKSLIKEIPRCQRFISRPALDVLLTAHGTDEKKKRDEELRKAHFEYGYSFSEIGRHTGLHYATVSKIVRRK